MRTSSSNGPRTAETGQLLTRDAPAVIHFVSDLHLSPQAAGIGDRLLAYLAGEARQAESLFILGDLFEAWPGDDCIDDPSDPYAGGIVAALRALHDQGTRIFAQHGNRDFLLGATFAERSGAQLLPDPYVLSLPSWQFVLSHGDALCLADAEYQAIRSEVRSASWREAWLARPLDERKALAAQLRRQSAATQRERASQGMPFADLDPAATDDFLREHGYATFIHGHTHRPAKHDHLVDGIHVERWVLADWRDDRGEYLNWDGDRLSRHAV